MRSQAIVVGLLALLAGCASAPPPGNPGDANEATVVVDGDDGSVALLTNDTTGALYGHVRSDAGFGLSGARVTVWGHDHGVETNATGWFEMTGIEPGRRAIRAEHRHYRPAEAEVNVEAAKAHRLTFTLIPVSTGDAGARPHLHDYWGDRTEVVVIDHTFEFHRQRPVPIGPVGQLGSKVLQVYQAECVYGSGTKAQYVSPFWFDDPNQIVWPGTKEIVVRIQWGPTDYPAGDRVGLVWRAPNMTGFAWSPGLTSGQEWTIPVELPMWDSAHQAFTLWEFGLCVGGRDESYTPVGIVGRAYLGTYHVDMALRGSSPEFADPPHPQFWVNGSVIRVLNETRTISCAESSTVCSTTAWQGRATYEERYFVFRPAQLIPPGTDRVRAWLNWSYSTPLAERLGLAISPADVPPTGKREETSYVAVSPAEQHESGNAYIIRPDASQTDSFYQTRSNWAFLWGYEGREEEPSFLLRCACELTVTLEVEAVRLPP